MSTTVPGSDVGVREVPVKGSFRGCTTFPWWPVRLGSSSCRSG